MFLFIMFLLSVCLGAMNVFFMVTETSYTLLYLVCAALNIVAAIVCVYALTDH